MHLTDQMIGPDESEQAAREDEQIREQRWAEFVAWLQKRNGPRNMWANTLEYVAAHLRGNRRYFNTLEIDKRLRGFAETEGWPNTLRAIARALEESEKAS